MANESADAKVGRRPLPLLDAQMRNPAALRRSLRAVPPSQPPPCVQKETPTCMLAFGGVSPDEVQLRADELNVERSSPAEYAARVRAVHGGSGLLRRHCTVFPSQ